MGQELAVAGLSDQQRKFVEAIMAGRTEEEAKLEAGYADSTPIVGILRGKLVENAISAFVDGELKGRLKLKALRTLESLMDGKSAQVALGAAKIVFEHGQDDSQGEDKPLSEMSREDLEAMIDQLEAEKAARAKDVTPNNGA